MLVDGPLLTTAADTSSLLPTLIAIGIALLGGSGVAGVLTALATRRNYVTTGYQNLTDASAKEAADERAAKERAEYRADRWRAYAYALRDELAANGIASKAIPPVDHPSEVK